MPVPGVSIDLEKLLPGFPETLRANLEKAIARSLAETLRGMATRLEQALPTAPTTESAPTLPAPLEPTPSIAPAPVPKKVMVRPQRVAPGRIEPIAETRVESVPAKPAAARPVRSACPGCGAPGLIPWDRLDKLYQCQRCRRVVRLQGGRWVEVPQFSTAQRRGCKVGPRSLALTIGLAACLLVAMVWRPWQHKGADVPPLPRELDPRAELVALAWLQRDLPALRRLTSTTHDRAVYAWLVRNPPPDLPQGTKPANVEIRLLDQKPHEKSLSVLLHGLPGAPELELRQQWVEREETWYFIPPAGRPS